MFVRAFIRRQSTQATNNVGVEKGQCEVGFPLLREQNVVLGVLVLHVGEALELLDRHELRFITTTRVTAVWLSPCCKFWCRQNVREITVTSVLSFS